MSDDHAAHAISAYVSRINETPNIDRDWRRRHAAGQPGARGPANPVEWDWFDLIEDPLEVRNIYGTPDAAQITVELQAELARVQAQVGDQPFPGL